MAEKKAFTHQSYTGFLVDMKKVEELAYKRSTDRKDPQGTLIHYHDYKEICYYGERIQTHEQEHKFVRPMSNEGKING
jgi:hypothetical protein